MYEIESAYDFHEIQNLHGLNKLIVNQTYIGSYLNLANLIELTDLIIEDYGDYGLEEVYGIANLTKLVNLKIYSDKLHSLLGLSNKPNLKTLRVLASKFRAFPNLSGLASLERLEIVENEITFQELPDLSSLVNLKELTLYRLKMESFPDISELPSLETAFFFYHKVMDISPLLIEPLSEAAKVTLELECRDDISTRNDIPSWLKLYVSDINFEFNTPEGVCENN